MFHTVYSQQTATNFQDKTCERCGAVFQCRPNDIANCQCNKPELTEAQHTYLHDTYKDCLCSNCLNELIRIFR